MITGYALLARISNVAAVPQYSIFYFESRAILFPLSLRMR